MKKNKKYWKKQAKNWRSYGLEMQDLFFAEIDRVHQLEHEVGVFKGLANERLIQCEKQAVKLKATRHELILLRQYTIGKKTHTTGTSPVKVNWKTSNLNEATATRATNNWAKWAIKQYDIPVGADPILMELSDLASKDQLLRKQYMKSVSDFNGDWKRAREEWIASGKGVRGDLFADISSGRQDKAKRLIHDNIDLIKKHPLAIQNAWLLVQHMDGNVKFQTWFLNYIKPESEEYKLLVDRIAVNKGEPQKYNTQNIFKPKRWWRRNR
jgi:hypothetical protein